MTKITVDGWHRMEMNEQKTRNQICVVACNSTFSLRPPINVQLCNNTNENILKV